MPIPHSEREPPHEDAMIQLHPQSPDHKDTTDCSQSDPGIEQLETDLSSPWGHSIQTIPRPTAFDLTRPLPQLPKEVILHIMKLLDPLSQFFFSLTASDYRREYNHYKLGGIYCNNIWPIYPRSDSWLIPVPEFKWPTMIDDRINEKDFADSQGWYCSMCSNTMHRKHWKKCDLERQMNAWDAQSTTVSRVRRSKKPAKSKSESKGGLADASSRSDARAFEKSSYLKPQSICSPALKPPSEIVWDLLTSIRTSNSLYASLLREERKYNDSKLLLHGRSDAEEMHMPAQEEHFRDSKCTRYRVQEIITVRGRKKHIIEELGDNCGDLVSIGVTYWNCDADWPLGLDDLSVFEKDGGKYWVPWEEVWKKLRI